MYIQKKDRKIAMIWKEYNSKIKNIKLVRKYVGQKCSTENWIEINEEVHGTYNTIV